MDITQLGPYKIIRQIGRGGMGTVYEAVHQDTSEVVALKSLLTARSSDAKFRRRFEAEIITLLHLDHPNIVRILSHGQDQGHLFFAMQLVDGKSLYDRLKEGGPLPWAEVTGYTLDICEGLRHAHDRGFIHRDLKPGNLLLDKNGRVQITDFGIARDSTVMRDDRREQITSPGGVVGTLDFMSPEQLRGEAATVRSDLYSLGCVMYALLAGRTPFTFKTVGDAQVTIMSTPPTRIGLLVPKLPAGLERIIMRLLEVDPSKRPGSALAVTKRLNEFLESRASEPSDAEAEVDDEEVSDDFKLKDDADVHSQKTIVSRPSESDQTAMSTRKEKEGTNPPVAEGGTDRFLPTVATQGDAWGAKPKTDYFSNVGDERVSDRSWDLADRQGGPIWPYIAALCVVLTVLLVGLYWVLIRKPNPDQLYAKISTSILEEEDPSAVESEIAQFLQRFPDDERRGEVRQYQVEIEARRLPRKLNRTLQFRGTAGLNEIEREFLGTLRLSETRPTAALSRLRTIVDVYQGGADIRTEKCLAAVRQQVVWLESIVEEARLKRQEQIEIAVRRIVDDVSLTRDEARRRYESLLLLYDDDPALAHSLVPVREKLAELVEAGS